jgi:hypothetical protein
LDLAVHASDVSRVRAAEVIRSELRAVGIDVRVDRQSDDDYFAGQDPGVHVALRMDNWIKDFPSASTFFPVLLKGSSVGRTNLSMLGATPAQLRKYGYAVRSVPSADARIEACEEQVFDAQTRCWAQLDQYLSEQVVPWVPLTEELTGWLHSTRVTRAPIDASVSLPVPALDNVRLRAEPTSAVASPSSPPPGASSSVLPDGVYRVTLSIGDLVRFGLPKDDEEDTGTFTVVLKDGWFLWHQRGDATIFNPIALGRVEGAGNQVRFDELQPYYNAGTFSDVTWRADGDSLVFDLPRCSGVAAKDRFFCGFQKALFTAHPWERVPEVSGGWF